MKMTSLTRPLIGLIAAATLSLGGCATPAVEESSLPTLVTTTNVWGNVVQQIVGDNYEVVSLINDPAQDPHSYEATARDQLAIEGAELVIVNGGGYDDFGITLADVAGTEIFNIYELHEAAHAEEDHDDEAEAEEHAEEEHDHAEEGHEHSHDGSDHLWYDAHVARHSMKLLVERLSELNPEVADQLQANWDAFAADTKAIEARIEALANPEVHYFEAHPMTALLMSALGFENLTPEGFAEAEEAGLEPAVEDLATANDLIDGREISFIALNSQVTSQTMETLAKRAEANGIALLYFDELLPQDTSYQDWFNSVLDQIEAAVR